MPDRPNVFISSTARDLPLHRKEVMDACLRQGMYPVMMEHLPAADADAISESLRMADEAAIYLGIFAHRYGKMPTGHDISITEMEYERAVKRGIPRLIFIMDRTHTISIDEVEMGEGALKLAALKERLKQERVVGFFDSPADLRAKVIDSLSRYRVVDLTAFHYVSAIPKPPAPYIAHPYTLSQTQGLVGRQAELLLLTDWVAQPSATIYQTRILNVVAIGGMGKSALIWKWFNQIAPLKMQPLAGCMWWSFYESDASFENFIIRALAYVTGRAREEIAQETKPGEREEVLLHALDREPYLIVLDGLERILMSYTGMDAARLADNNLDERTTNVGVAALGLPASAAQSFTGQHRLRKTADPRAGSFLRKLASVQASRILVSTRLYPADLQNITGEPLPGCFAVFLTGLIDDDALNLWRAFSVTGTHGALVRLFHSFENHPLLIQALASEVAYYRVAPGDFVCWRNDHPQFNPFALPLVQVKTHVLEFALRGLNDAARELLQTIAAFRMPVHQSTLVALVAEIKRAQPPRRGFYWSFVSMFGDKVEFSATTDERILDRLLSELEDRGLLGWDRRSNRYDLHPVVRGIVWSGLSEQARRYVYATLHAYLASLPMIKQWQQVNSIDDLTPAIELYNTLIGLGRYEEAFTVFQDYLEEATLYRLSTSRQRTELLELLFPDGLEQLPRLGAASNQAWALNALALSYDLSGQPKRAARLYDLHNTIQERADDQYNLCIGLCNLAYTLNRSGALRASETATHRALYVTRSQKDRFREAIGLLFLGLTLATRGADEAESILKQSLKHFVERRITQSEGLLNAYLAQQALWRSEVAVAFALANRAWELAHDQRQERDFIRAARLQGAAALGLSNLEIAEERLHHALTRAQTINFVEEELPASIALAELRQRQGNPKAARELLDDVWDATERGPYPLYHADAFNVLAQIECDAGNVEAALAAASRAYTLAWCDGPPFAYHWGLVAARAHLAALGASEPALPPFDESQHAPMVAVEIDPVEEK
jgi:Domain of unknown function (DUF4062)